MEIRLKVLVVTGEPDVGRLVGDMLQLDGHVVTNATDGRTAVRSMVAGLPDVLVIDARLADVAGIEVVRAMRRAPGGPAVHVVLLADDVVKSSGPAESLGVKRVVAKPVSLLDLADCVREAEPAPAPRAKGRATPETHLELDRPMTPTLPTVRHTPLPLRTGHPKPTPPPGPQASSPPPPKPVAPAPPPRAVGGRVVPPPATSPAAVAQLLVRLKREVKLVEEADAWTVLGVPRRSPAPLVGKAIARARDRYAPLARDAHPEVRALAIRVLRRIEAAATETGIDLDLASATDDGLDEGRALLERGEWAAADAFFETARDARPDSAPAMAGLGWARFHNPSLPQASREEDGRALLELALTFDRALPDAWFWLATLDVRRGDADSAMTRLQRALKLDPVHAGASLLLRELRDAAAPRE